MTGRCIRCPWSVWNTTPGTWPPRRVVDRRRRLRLAAMPSSRISAATVFSLTRQPSSRRSAVIRGEPYLPPWTLNRPATSALSRSRRAARGPGLAVFHL